MIWLRELPYELDVTKPFGQRIQSLRFKGQPLSPTQKLRVVTNNYRVNGGGGFTMYKDAPVVYRSSEEVRELIIDWVEKHKTVPTQADNNWRIGGRRSLGGGNSPPPQRAHNTINFCWKPLPQGATPLLKTPQNPR